MSDDEKLKPRNVVYLNLQTDPSATAVETPKEGGGGGDGTDLCAVAASDDFLAVELVKELRADWRCAMPGAQWYNWNGSRWQRDDLQSVFEPARMVCRREAQTIQKDTLARAVSSKTTIYSVAKLASTDRVMAVPISTFDTNDWILNTPKHTIDLRTGQARDHARADYCSRSTRVSAEGECPIWLTFLHEATGKDPALSGFAQRVAGYCATGSTREHAIFFLEGPGATGKSIFLNTLQWILGDYATAAPMDVFTVATGERHPADQALLHGARLVTASETEEGRRWDEAKLKHFTGGDPITARHVRQDFFTFDPKFKLLMAGNFRPAMRSADDAMRRRFHIIPWKVKPVRPDQQLIERLRAEAGGILKWAIEGAVMWQAKGLAPPPAVVGATDEYFEAENVIGRWIAERCSRQPDDTALIKQLFADFKSWAATTGEFIGTERRFAQRLERSGLERWREAGTGQRGFRGIAPLVRQGELGMIIAAPRAPAALAGPLDDADEWERHGPRE